YADFAHRLPPLVGHAPGGASRAGALSSIYPSASSPSSAGTAASAIIASSGENNRPLRNQPGANRFFCPATQATKNDPISQTKRPQKTPRTIAVSVMRATPSAAPRSSSEFSGASSS